MTAVPPRPTSPRDTRPLYTRPRIVFTTVAGTMLAAALLMPEPSAGRSGDARLTTYSTSAQGGRLFYDLVRKLGWRVARRDSAAIFTDERTIHAVLAPVRPLRPVEAHDLLEHARNGGALFVVLVDVGSDALADSLRISHRSTGASPIIEPADTAGCASHPRGPIPMLWPGTLAFIYRLQWHRQAPDSLEVFLRVSNTAAAAPIRPGAAERPIGPPPPRPRPANPRLDAPSDALIGFPYGKGRIVVGSDPDLVRNDALRVCEYGLDVPVTRALEYLRAGGAQPRDLFVVDEYHQGYGSQPGAFGAVVRYLGATASGRLFAQLIAAGLVLILALAPRMVSPREDTRIERRSPLEHVDALARAYERVRATRTVTLRLLRGLRRRVHRASPSGATETNEVFLARVERATPKLAPSVALIRRALASTVSQRELADVGAALHDVESSLTRMSL